MESTAPNDAALLRVTLLSLEGIRCRPADGGVVTALAGFRAPGFPPAALRVPSSHYSPLLAPAAGGGAGGLLAFETAAPGRVRRAPWPWRGARDGVDAVHWRRGGDADAGGADGDGGPAAAEGDAPHLEVELAARGPAGAPSWRGALEVHVCVVRAPAAGDDAGGEGTGGPGDEDADPYRGTARLTFSPSELGAADGDAAGGGYDRRGGKVVLLPVRASPDPRRAGASMLTPHAMLSVRVEKVAVPATRGREQRHFVESDWRGGSCAPPSVAPAAGHERSVGLGQLYRRAACMMATEPAAEPPPRESTPPPRAPQPDFMVGRVVEVLAPAPGDGDRGRPATEDAPPGARAVLEPWQPNVVPAPDAPKAPLAVRSLGARLLCGAGGAGFAADVGAALQRAGRRAGAAGHHCDEDHVGWYVADTDAGDGSSRLTADPGWGA